MSPLTKALIATSLALAVGAGYYILQISHQRDQMHQREQQTEARETQIRKLREETNQAPGALAAIQNEIESLRHQTKYATKDSELSAWLDRVDQLKQALRDAPKKGIPEMQFLNSNDWLSVTLDDQLETDAKIRSALSKLRELAKMKPQIVANLAKALQTYSKANNGAPPTDPMQLRSYLDPQLSDEILRRYEPAPEVPVENDANGLIREGLHMTGSGRIVLQEMAPVDEDYDTWTGFTEKGGWALQPISQLGKIVNTAMKDFAKANNGQTASTPDQLLPYLPTSVEPTRLKEYWAVSRR